MRYLTFELDPNPDAEVNAMNKALIQASGEGNTEKINSLLLDGAQVNVVNTNLAIQRLMFLHNP